MKYTTINFSGDPLKALEELEDLVLGPPNPTACCGLPSTKHCLFYSSDPADYANSFKGTDSKNLTSRSEKDSPICSVTNQIDWQESEQKHYLSGYAQGPFYSNTPLPLSLPPSVLLIMLSPSVNPSRTWTNQIYWLEREQKEYLVCTRSFLQQHTTLSNGRGLHPSEPPPPREPSAISRRLACKAIHNITDMVWKSIHTAPQTWHIKVIHTAYKSWRWRGIYSLWV